MPTAHRNKHASTVVSQSSFVSFSITRSIGRMRTTRCIVHTGNVNDYRGAVLAKNLMGSATVISYQQRATPLQRLANKAARYAKTQESNAKVHVEVISPVLQQSKIMNLHRYCLQPLSRRAWATIYDAAAAFLWSSSFRMSSKNFSHVSIVP
jgi:hypothetical protein